jgi:RNA polymerase sigma-70 factor (ECF subfamily)
MIASLPRDQAEAIMLRTVLGFDAPTAATILGKRPGAVRAAAHRGLKQLAKRISDEP